MSHAVEVQDREFVATINVPNTLPWRYLAASENRADLKTSEGVLSRTLTYGVDYIVSPEGDTAASTGSLTLLASPTDTETILHVYADAADVQPVVAEPGTEALVKSLDRRAIVSQQHDRRIRVLESSDDVAAASAAAAAASAAVALAAAPNTLSLEAFGAVGDAEVSSDGVLVSGTDDTVSLQLALDWMNAEKGRKLRSRGGATYLTSSTLVCAGHSDVDFSGSKLFIASNVEGLRASPDLFGPFALASSYIDNALTLDLTGSPLPYAPRPGQILKIVSDALDPTNRDRGSEAYKYRVAEFFRCGVGSTAETLVLDSPLICTRGVSQTSVPGDESLYPSYTTASNARIVFADPDQRFDWVGGVIQYESGHSAAPWDQAPFSVYGYINPIIRDLTLDRYYYSGLLLGGTYAARVGNPTFNRGENNPAQGQLGYGIIDAGANSVVYGINSYDTRHAYTTGNTTLLDNDASLLRSIRAGRAIGSVISGNSSGGTSTHWDTHHGAEKVSFRDTSAGAGGDYSMGFRGVDVRSDGASARGTAKGDFVFTEYDSGQPDDDLFTNGKSVRDFTSASLGNRDYDIIEVPLSVSNATANLFGKSRYQSNDHCAIYDLGGVVIIEGHHEFVTLSGLVTHSREGCIEIDPVSAASAFSKAYIIIEGTVIIDASASLAATMYALKLAENTELIVRGRLKFVLPASVTGFKTGLGEVRTEFGGIIEYSIIGSNDNTIGSAIEFDGCRVISSDGLINWFGEAGWNLLLNDQNFGGSHTGDIVRTTIADPDCQDVAYLMDQAGEGNLQFVFEGEKSGGAGSVEFQIRSNNTNFVWNGIMDAGDNSFRIIVDVSFKASGEQVYVVDFDSIAPSGTTTRSTQRKPETQAFIETGHAVVLSATLASPSDVVTVDQVAVYGTKGGVI